MPRIKKTPRFWGYSGALGGAPSGYRWALSHFRRSGRGVRSVTTPLHQVQKLFRKPLRFPSSYKRRLPPGYRIPANSLQAIAYKASKRYYPKKTYSRAVLANRRRARNPFR